MKLFLIGLFAFSVAMNGMAQKTFGEDPTLDDELHVWIPNAFTPNFDGANDVFVPVISGPELEMYELIILDRYGKEVFYSKDPSEVWNGSVKGGGYLSTTNIFIYFLKVKSVASLEVETFRGHVVLVR